MSLIKVPVMQFSEVDGGGDTHVLAFAKAYFTQTGTTTPVITYQDAVFQVEHPDPVQADAQGLFPAVFCDPDLGLVRARVIAEDGDLDNPLIDVDPINDEEPNTLASVVFVIEGLGDVIATGAKGSIPVEFDCDILQVTLLCEQTGSIVVDLFKDEFVNFPPDVSDSICASAKPTIVAGKTYKDSTLTGWTTAINAGDIIRFNVDSCTTVESCTVSLKVRRR